MNDTDSNLPSNIPLGQSTAYVSQYDPAQLCPVPRSQAWKARGLSECPHFGVDIWTGYEVSWLNAKGLPQVVLAEFAVPADSPNIIESKSFKLYLNSFNMSRYSSQDEVFKLMQQDLSDCAGATVKIRFHSLNEGLEISPLQGRCIDAYDVEINHYEPAPQLLTTLELRVKEQLVSHLLKSNCPVTGQPDWASVQISYEGQQIDREGLLAYIVSYREKGGFHEDCVEQIFLDIMERCQPHKLSVYARYTRRGGLDINPFRSTETDAKPQSTRLSRQ